MANRIVFKLWPATSRLKSEGKRDTLLPYCRAADPRWNRTMELAALKRLAGCCTQYIAAMGEMSLSGGGWGKEGLGGNRGVVARQRKGHDRPRARVRQ